MMFFCHYAVCFHILLNKMFFYNMLFNGMLFNNVLCVSGFGCRVIHRCWSNRLRRHNYARKGHHCCNTRTGNPFDHA